jgi:hypothetical protein
VRNVISYFEGKNYLNMKGMMDIENFQFNILMNFITYPGTHHSSAIQDAVMDKTCG